MSPLVVVARVRAPDAAVTFEAPVPSMLKAPPARTSKVVSQSMSMPPTPPSTARLADAALPMAIGRAAAPVPRLTAPVTASFPMLMSPDAELTSTPSMPSTRTEPVVVEETVRSLESRDRVAAVSVPNSPMSFDPSTTTPRDARTVPPVTPSSTLSSADEAVKPLMSVASIPWTMAAPG